MNYYINLCRNVLYWLLPIVILYIVFHKINLQEFKKNIIQTNIFLVLLGIACSPILSFIAAIRWNILLKQYVKTNISLGFCFKNYLIGLALGIFIPGSLGLDGYRVAIFGRNYGHYMLHLGATMMEKLAALFTCVSLFIVLYPLVLVILDQPITDNIITIIYILFVAIMMLIGSALLMHHSIWFYPLVEKFEQYISNTVQAIIRKIPFTSAQNDFKVSLQKMFKPFFGYKAFLLVLGLSLTIHFIKAVGYQIFFLALDYEIPFIVNLFVRPIISLLFTIPISFGGLGIREASFIIIYGLFGVPVETALLVSFFGLSGRLFNIAIGGLLILIDRSYADPLKIRLKRVN